MRFRRILVAVKNPDVRLPALVAKAAQIARATGAGLELFHALDSPMLVEMGGASERSAKERERAVGESLAKLAARLGRYRVRVTTHVEWDFPAADAIVRRAKAMRADLIVAGRHGGKHTLAWLLGLTDWDLLRLSPVPVLLVKSAELYRRPTILAAIDPGHAFAKPSGLDAQILGVAGAMTEAMHGRLHALHSYMPNPYTAPVSGYMVSGGYAAQLHHDAEEAARTRFDKALEASEVSEARRHLIDSHPVDAIPATARRTGSAIVVMGAVSRSGLRRVFIGNTAERVLDRLTCDVLVVKPKKFRTRVSTTRRGPRWLAAPLAAP